MKPYDDPLALLEELPAAYSRVLHLDQQTLEKQANTALRGVHHDLLNAYRAYQHQTARTNSTRAAREAANERREHFRRLLKLAAPALNPLLMPLYLVYPRAAADHIRQLTLHYCRLHVKEPHA